MKQLEKFKEYVGALNRELGNIYELNGISVLGTTAMANITITQPLGNSDYKIVIKAIVKLSKMHDIRTDSIIIRIVDIQTSEARIIYNP